MSLTEKIKQKAATLLETAILAAAFAGVVMATQYINERYFYGSLCKEYHSQKHLSDQQIQEILDKDYAAIPWYIKIDKGLYDGAHMRTISVCRKYYWPENK